MLILYVCSLCVRIEDDSGKNNKPAVVEYWAKL